MSETEQKIEVNNGNSEKGDIKGKKRPAEDEIEAKKLKTTNGAEEDIGEEEEHLEDEDELGDEEDIDGDEEDDDVEGADGEDDDGDEEEDGGEEEDDDA